MVDPRVKAYTVAVRALCEFAAKQGDLDLRFTSSPTSQQGIAGHQTARGAPFGDLSQRGLAERLVTRVRHQPL